MKKSMKYKAGVIGAALGALIPSVALALTIQVGMNVNLGWNLASADAPQVMSTLSTNNIKTVRQFFNWSVIQPTDGSTYDWRWIDNVMRNAAINGEDVLPVFYYTPGWANGNAGVNVLPTSNALFTNFVKAAFLRYGVNGTFWSSVNAAPAPLVTAEIWNEPWCKAFLKSTDPLQYAQLVRDSAVAIHSVNLNVKILASTDWYPANNSIWLPQLLAAMPDFAQYINIASVHLYFTNFAGPSGADPYSKLGSIRNYLTKYKVTAPIWITESGINARMVDQYELGNTQKEISQQAQLQTAQEYLAVLAAINNLATIDNIERYYIFLYQRSPVAGTTLSDGFSLADTNLQPTAAAKAIFSWVASHPVTTK